MKQRKANTRRLTQLALLLALVLIMSYTPLGYLPVGRSPSACSPSRSPSGLCCWARQRALSWAGRSA